MSDGPRVLLVSPEYPPLPGGIGDYTALLARHLGLMGATATVLTTGDGSPHIEERDESGTLVFRHVSHWGWRLAARVRRAAWRADARIVHIQYQTGMYAMHPAIALLPSLLGRRYRVVTTFHDLLPPYLFPKAGPLRDGVTRLLACTSDAVIATNGADAQTLRRWGVSPALVPIGSNIPVADGTAGQMQSGERFRTRDSGAWAQFCARYGIAPDAVLLTTFGLLNQSKGLDTIIDTLALLRAGGTPAHLLLVGAGAGTTDPTNRTTDAALSARIAAAGLTQFVSRTGSLSPPDVADALAWSDVCLLPYRDGASPRRGSLLAALAQGVPVVTTAPEGNAYAGLSPLSDAAVAFVPPDDAAATVTAARHILADTDYAARLRTGARSYAAHFDWATIARCTLAAYANGAGSSGDAEADANAQRQSGMMPQAGADAGVETGRE